MSLVLRLINIVVLVIVGLIAVGVALYLLGANEQNTVVATVLSIDRVLVAPFRLLFELQNNNAQVVLNWGIAALVYLGVGILITRLLGAATGRRGRAGE